VGRQRRWGLATIYVKSSRLINKCVIFKIRKNFVVIRYEHLFFFSVYIAPSESNYDFNVILDDLNAVIRSTEGDCIITGDFRAKSVLWGSPGSSLRGVLERWAAELDLRIINVGNTPTCVRHNGSSIIDLTWSSPTSVVLFRISVCCRTSFRCPTIVILHLVLGNISVAIRVGALAIPVGTPKR